MWNIIKNIFKAVQHYGDATNEYNFHCVYSAEFIKYMKTRG